MVCYTHRVQEKGSCHATEGHVGKHRGWSGGREWEENEKNVGESLQHVSHRQEWTVEARWPGWFESFQQAPGHETISSCLAPRPGLMRAGG